VKPGAKLPNASASMADPKLSCPASPISLSTACGISRFS
jgi:hypothetical protein